jgi:hypothetical protein
VRPGRNEALRILERSPFKMAFPGLGKENYRFHDHEKLAHYANAAADIEFNFPFGFKERVFTVLILILKRMSNFRKKITIF